MLRVPGGCVQLVAPRVPLRNLFWSKVVRKPSSIWTCTAGPPGLAEPHMDVLERLFLQAAPTPLVKKGGGKAGVSPCSLCGPDAAASEVMPTQTEDHEVQECELSLLPSGAAKVAFWVVPYVVSIIPAGCDGTCIAWLHSPGCMIPAIRCGCSKAQLVIRA